MARKMRIQGRVVIKGTLGWDGSLRESAVMGTSGFTLLDSAALRAVRSVAQYPPVPPELQGDHLDFELPVSFSKTAE